MEVTVLTTFRPLLVKALNSTRVDGNRWRQREERIEHLAASSIGRLERMVTRMLSARLLMRSRGRSPPTGVAMSGDFVRSEVFAPAAVVDRLGCLGF